MARSRGSHGHVDSSSRRSQNHAMSRTTTQVTSRSRTSHSHTPRSRTPHSYMHTTITHITRSRTHHDHARLTVTHVSGSRTFKLTEGDVAALAACCFPSCFCFSACRTLRQSSACLPEEKNGRTQNLPTLRECFFAKHRVDCKESYHYILFRDTSLSYF